MKKQPLHSEIKNLKALLSNNKIEVSDAIDKFISLLNSYEHRHTGEDEEQIFYKKTWSKISKELYQENEKLKDRSNNLNKILVLLELGMRFNTDELDQILTQ